MLADSLAGSIQLYHWSWQQYYSSKCLPNTHCNMPDVIALQLTVVTYMHSLYLLNTTPALETVLGWLQVTGWNISQYSSRMVLIVCLIQLCHICWYTEVEIKEFMFFIHPHMRPHLWGPISGMVRVCKVYQWECVTSITEVVASAGSENICLSNLCYKTYKPDFFQIPRWL